MRIGFVGLGKLGLPVAAAISHLGHDVVGHDVDPSRMSRGPQPFIEAGAFPNSRFDDYLAAAERLRFGSLDEVVRQDLVFIAVQTPHQSRYEGTTVLPPGESADFDYTALRAAVKAVIEAIQRGDHRPDIAIISTVLPGTLRRTGILDLGRRAGVRIAYNPQFIAMGTTVRDFLYPEFVLVGTTDEGPSTDRLTELYADIDAPMHTMSIESAEFTKVAYNTMIGLKLAFTGMVQQTCDLIPGASAQRVLRALRSATRRVASAAYMSPGVGDGGGCHPRDNLALSDMSRRLGLSYDLSGAAMEARQAWARYIAGILAWHSADQRGLPVALLGTSYKRNVAIETGSHVLLIADVLRREHGMEPELIDPVVGRNAHRIDGRRVTGDPAIFLLGCDHQSLSILNWFPVGSVLVSPFPAAARESYQGLVRLVEVGERLG